MLSRTIVVAILFVTLPGGITASTDGTGSPAAAAARETQDNTPNTLRLAEGAPRLPAKIEDLAWLTGRWVGEGLGGRIDEAWSEPDAGAMVGYFRLIKDGKPVFYEILTLLEAEGSVEMRLKHVNPDMTGWEEKNGFVTFRLVRHDATGAYFSGLTFRRTGPDTMDGFIALRDRSTGTVREEKLTYRRIKDGRQADLETPALELTPHKRPTVPAMRLWTEQVR